MGSNVIMVRSLDWSTFTSGFNVPVEVQPMLYELIGRSLERGDKMPIRIKLGGEIIEATLSNSKFDEKFKHPTDIVRVMYGTGSKLALKFQEVFNEHFSELSELKKPLPPRKQLKVPEEIKTYFTFSLNADGIFEIEPIEKIEAFSTLVSEDVFESQDISWVDRTAAIEVKEKLVKIRKIDRSICDNLKRLYDFRCQITGEKVGERYGEPVIEAHHIDYFVNSQNNDSSNIIIVSPNFHRIIHRHNPIFNRKELQFEFENGTVEKLTLNKHITLK